MAGTQLGNAFVNFFALLVLIFGTYISCRARQLYLRGKWISIDTSIVDCHVPPPGSEASIVIVVRFQLNGEFHIRTINTGSNDAMTYSRGNAISLLVNPNNPRKCILDTDYTGPVEKIAIWLVEKIQDFQQSGRFL